MKHYTLNDAKRFAKVYTQAQLEAVYAGRTTMTILDLIDSPYVPPEHKHEVVFAAMDASDIAAVVPVLLAKAQELYEGDAATVEPGCAVTKHQNTASIELKWISGAEFQARRALAGTGKVATGAALQLGNFVASRSSWDIALDVIKQTVGA